MKNTVLEEQKPKPKKEGEEEESKEEEISSCAAAQMAKDYVAPESPSNIKLMDTTIRSEGQKTLYKQFMNESKARNAGLKFDLMRAQQPSEKSEEESLEKLDERLSGQLENEGTPFDS